MLDPYSGAIFVFRARRAARIKLLIWDGSGLVLVYKRLEQGQWEDQGRRHATIAGTALALIEGLDWRHLHARRVARPTAAR